ncbi:MAG: hypothetical protein Q9215_005535 [Flavoplaca cf. flavocitrina]
MYTSSLPDRSKPPKAQKQKPTKQPKLANPPKAKRQETAKPAPDDPQMMFKVGFLSDVYQERLLESGIIKKVITREAGEAALRMKQNLDDGNPQMWDLFAYRISEKEYRRHHRTGDKWRIYPTYDFTHCLCDSFEGITHSLCTTEFELSRVSYEWLCDELEVYKPMRRESVMAILTLDELYGRLNVSGTLLSKRKIIELVNKGYVHGWDDPLLYTLIALRRQGMPPAAILSFVNELGVTKATTDIELHRFETSIRRYLEVTVPRLMLVLEPLTVIIDDLDDDHLEMVEVPFSKNSAYGVSNSHSFVWSSRSAISIGSFGLFPKVKSHTIPFTKTVYIERGDFREVDSDDYFRLAPGKTKDLNTGQVITVHAKYEKPSDGSAPKKPKSPIKATVRAFNPLFKSNNPSAHPDGFLADINPDSEQIFPHAMMECGFEEIKQRAPWPAEAGEKQLAAPDEPDSAKKPQKATPGPESIRFQGMRVAYFCVDRESTKDDLILNRVVSLKEDVGKV